jgi:hypothetical protein
MSDLINRIDVAIANAEALRGGLSKEAALVEGMTGIKVRFLLNHLCADLGAVYLEVGCYKGATLCSALSGNHGSVKKAYSFDLGNYLGEDTRTSFAENIARCLGQYREDQLNFIIGDAFALGRIGKGDATLYFYDGDHRRASQRDALTKMYSWLADEFIYVVDDWNEIAVQEGTFEGIIEASLNPKYFIALAHGPRGGDGRTEGWWNGLGIFVLAKR